MAAVRRIVIDPTCGKRLYEDQAFRTVVREELRWFCTEECARRFLESPWRYEDEEFSDRQKPR